MTSLVTISFTLATTDASAALGFEAWIDDHKFFDTDHVKETQKITVDLEDKDGAEPELRLILKNKTADHTQVDNSGNIVTDARLIISDLKFDGIELGHLACKTSTYIHNFNGSGQSTQTKFYGEMGCNGIATIKFTTPIYLWLLEQM
jgi:hypothetical protein